MNQLMAVAKIGRTVYDIFDFKLWKIVICINLPYFVCQRAWAVNVRQRCVAKFAFGMMTMKTRWGTARLWCQLV